MKPGIHQHLHALEEDLIQLRGLLKALLILDCDEGAIIASLNALTQRFGTLEEHFYELWQEIGADG